VVEMSAKTRNLERPTAVLLVKVVGGGGCVILLMVS